jgi:hypothetical protein
MTDETKKKEAPKEKKDLVNAQTLFVATFLCQIGGGPSGVQEFKPSEKEGKVVQDYDTLEVKRQLIHYVKEGILVRKQDFDRMDQSKARSKAKRV